MLTCCDKQMVQPASCCSIQRVLGVDDEGMPLRYTLDGNSGWQARNLADE